MVGQRTQTVTLAIGTSGQAAASSVESAGTHECETWPMLCTSCLVCGGEKCYSARSYRSLSVSMVCWPKPRIHRCGGPTWGRDLRSRPVGDGSV